MLSKAVKLNVVKRVSVGEIFDGRSIYLVPVTGVRPLFLSHVPRRVRFDGHRGGAAQDGGFSPRETQRPRPGTGRRSIRAAHRRDRCSARLRTVSDASGCCSSRAHFRCVYHDDRICDQRRAIGALPVPRRTRAGRGCPECPGFRQRIRAGPLPCNLRYHNVRGYARRVRAGRTFRRMAAPTLRLAVALSYGRRRAHRNRPGSSAASSESLEFMAQKGKNKLQVRKIVSKIAPALAADEELSFTQRRRSSPASP